MRSRPAKKRLTALTPLSHINRSIHLVRGEKVLLDIELAALYGVSVGVLNQAVKRNGSRFPDDFMFRLSAEEGDNLKSQIVISRSALKTGHGGRRAAPRAFTEQGVDQPSAVSHQ